MNRQIAQTSRDNMRPKIPFGFNTILKGAPIEKEIPKGTTLFKYAANPIMNKQEGSISPFWSCAKSEDADNSIVTSIENILKYYGESEIETFQVNSETMIEWDDNFIYVHKLTLAEDVLAWYSQVQPQHRTDNSEMEIPNLYLQYYIPFLAHWHIASFETFAIRSLL